MSDLQCPATFLVVRGSSATRVALGEGWRSSWPGWPGGRLADRLRDRRVEVVVPAGRRAAPCSRWRGAGALAGRPGRAGPPRVEGLPPTQAEAGGRQAAGGDRAAAGGQLQTLADLHRGETVLVVDRRGRCPNPQFAPLEHFDAGSVQRRTGWSRWRSTGTGWRLPDGPEKGG